MANGKKITRAQLRMRRRRRRRRILFCLEMIVLLILAGGLFLYSKMDNMDFQELNFENVRVNNSVADNEVMKGYKTIGLIGLDNRSVGADGNLDSGNSDTMIIASINNDTKKVKLVSVYRDTLLRVDEDEDGNGIYKKANSAYARGGKEDFLSMLNTNLDLNVTDTVTVDFAAVAETVDLLGGIDMELTQDEVVFLNDYCIETSEVTGKDYEKLEKVSGVHHLNGVQAVAYARIRYTAGNDFRRAARQREVISKMVEKAKKADLGTLNKIVDTVFPMISTTLSKSEILKMGMSMLDYEIEDQAGFPFDHLYGENVKNALAGKVSDTDADCVVPVTLESNVIKLHQFLYPEDAYGVSEEVKAYSERISSLSGYTIDDQLLISENGDLESYREDAHQHEQ